MVTHNDQIQAGERKFNLGEKSLNGYEIKKLWRNEDGRHFTDVSIASGAGDVHDARSFVAFDYDMDGDLDFFIRTYKAKSVLLRNEGVRGHWLCVRARGTKANRDGIGARIEIVAGGKRQMRVLTAGCAYESQFPNEAYFGLGEATRVESIDVFWPGGRVEHFGGADADQHLRVTEGKAGIEVLPTKPQPKLPAVDEGATDPFVAKLLEADLRDERGNRVDAAALAQPTLLAFWATWCNVCRGEFADLSKFARSNGPAGLKVAGIAVMDKEGPDLHLTCDELKPAFAIWTISRADYDRLFGEGAGVPRTLFVDHGRLLADFEGRFRKYLAASYVIEALRGK